MRSNFKGICFVTLASLIWGLSGIAQSIGNNYMGVFTFNTSRTLLGAMFLLPVAVISTRRSGLKEDRKKLLKGGMLAGASLWGCLAIQQFCLTKLMVGKVVFLMSLYVIIVPLLNWPRSGNPGKKYFAALAFILIGLYMLCMKGGRFDFSVHELLMLGCAFFSAVHILLTDHYVSEVNCFALICVEFATSAFLSIPAMLLFETPHICQLTAAWKPLLYVGLVATAGGYSFEALGQKRCDPSIASIILSLETVYAVFGAWLILGQAMTKNEIFGCALMLTGTIIAQIPQKGPRN